MSNTHGRKYSILSPAHLIRVDLPQDFWNLSSSSLKILQNLDDLKATIGEVLNVTLTTQLVNGINDLVMFISLPLDGRLSLVGCRIPFLDEYVADSELTENSTIPLIDRNGDGFYDYVILRFGRLRHTRKGYDEHGFLSVEISVVPTDEDSVKDNDNITLSVLSLFQDSNYSISNTRVITFIEPAILTIIL